MYDKDKHILLVQEAHMRRIDCERAEFEKYVRLVKKYPYSPQDKDARLNVFEVDLPEWPPVERPPLALIMTIMGEKGGGPFEGMAWTGRHLAVKNGFWERKALKTVAKQMVPLDQNYEPDRLSYMWQVPIFDEEKHVVVRYWCSENNVSIVSFIRDFIPAKGIELVKTTNPRVKQEREKGGFTPTRRSLRRSELHLAEAYFGKESSISDSPSPEPRPIKLIPNPKIELIETPNIVEDDPDGMPEPSPIYENTISYTPSQVLHSLRGKLERDFRLFGGQTSDRMIVSIRKDAMIDFLESDPTDKMSYVEDRGGRNYDCDNFADTLRNSINRKYGLNCVGIIWGDTHAWNFFVVNGVVENSLDSGPRIFFVEPQDDRIIDDLTGGYSIDRRCEVYL